MNNKDPNGILLYDIQKQLKKRAIEMGVTNEDDIEEMVDLLRE